MKIHFHNALSKSSFINAGTAECLCQHTSAAALSSGTSSPSSLFQKASFEFFESCQWLSKTQMNRAMALWLIARALMC